jgi:L-lactate utilization protein LutC
MNETKWTTVPSADVITKVIGQLAKNGIEAVLATNREDAKAKALSYIPLGAEVMTMTSVTTHELGIDQALNDAAQYQPVRDKLYAMDHATQDVAMRRLGAAAEYTVGSLHAVTEAGQLVIASNTGSQLPAEAYGSAHVVFVVGVQKIVANLDEAFKRVYEHSLPLESERAKVAYGVAGSSVNKLLIINEETPGRIVIVFVPEVIGY